MKVKKKTIAKKQTGKNSKTKKLTSKTSKKPKKQRGKTPKKTKTSKEIRDIYIERINKILDKIIKENTDKGSPENDFKVRPGYGYDKFYLTWVEGSYDMSLQSLIHYIMYEEGIYKEFLTKEQYKDVQKAIKEEPNGIYGINEEDDEKDIQYEIIDPIYYQCITHVGKELIRRGFDVKKDFEEYLD